MEHFPGLQLPIQECKHNTSGYSENGSSASVLEVRDLSTTTWETNLNADKLRELLAKETKTPRTTLEVFFVSGGKNEPNPRLPILDRDILQTLVEKAGMSRKFCRDVSRTKEWAKLHVGSSIILGAGPPKVTFHYGFWVWDANSSHSFVECQTDINHTKYFCINLPKACVDRIVEVMSQDPSQANKLFYMDCVLLDGVIPTYVEAISSRRSKLKEIEDEKQSNTNKTQRSSVVEVNTKELHNLCVEWHSIHTDLIDFDAQIDALQGLYNNIPRQQTQGIEGCNHTLQMLRSQCRSYARWTSNYLERTNIRINLHHHLASHIVARQSQQESRSMLVLSVVTTLFLPGTFVSTILSTAFFDFSQVALEVSQTWWILPVSAVPLTFVVAAFLIWIQRQTREEGKAVRKSSV